MTVPAPLTTAVAPRDPLALATVERRDESLPDLADSHVRAALRAGGLGRWDWDPSNDRVTWDDQASYLFRTTASTLDADQQAFLSAIDPRDHARVGASLGRARLGQEEFEESFLLVGPPEHPRWLLARGRMLDRAGDPQLMTGVVLDVTAAQLAAERSFRLLEVAAALAAAKTPEEVASAALTLGVQPLGLAGADLQMLDDRGIQHRLGALIDGAYRAKAAAVRTGGGRGETVLPLTVAGRRVGALSLTVDGRAISPLDHQFLLTLATQVAQALDRVVLYARSAEVAAALQRQLLPERLTHLPTLELAGRYVPGAAGLEVGGDWYDVIPAGRDAVALVLGDVVGKGLRAAGTMAHMRHAVNAYAIAGPAPSVVLRQTDALAEVVLDESEIVTVVYCLLHPATGVMSFANAGHLPPLVLTAAGADFLPMEPQPPLGAVLLSNTERVDEAAVLPPGAALLLYSDGLVERRGQDLDQGMARLRAVASRAYADPTIPLERLIDVLLEHLVGDERPDDIALLVARPRGVTG